MKKFDYFREMLGIELKNQRIERASKCDFYGGFKG
jgi:hypothetical protein